MFHRLILGTVLFLISSVISNLIVEDDLFEAHLQEMDTEAGSGQEVEEDGSGGGSGGSGEMTTCEDSLFGCCPDSSLPAHGPDHVGCCLEGEGGCCPDYQRSPGSGEDCGCESSRFGCCPDEVTARWTEDDGGKYSVTTAVGSSDSVRNVAGCGCKHTTFGCCQDQFTTAAGEITKQS